MGGHRRRTQAPRPNAIGVWRVCDPDRVWTAAEWGDALEGHDYNRGLIAARELRRLLAEHERRHAQAAYRAGLDWDQIGRRLGMSRQGAWKRFHDRIASAR